MSLSKTTYSSLLSEIKKRIRNAQYEALRSVNKELINLYWDIGRMIVNRQQASAWGRSVVERLADDLQKEFVGEKGFSAQNLWRMRQFYETYHRDSKLSPLVREIGWSHNVVILMNCKTPAEREFYLHRTKHFGWSKNVLIHQIEARAHRQIGPKLSNFPTTLGSASANHLVAAVKDEYGLGFLEIRERHSERELEKAILLRIDGFLREMGGLFAFMGSQYRLEVSGEEYFIDILLYHRHLHCLVALELKVGEFIPEYVGKMQFYLAALDELVRQKSERPSIGIILCKSKDRTTVEYALRNARKPIGVASYSVVTKLPKKLKEELPGPAQIRRLIKDIK